MVPRTSRSGRAPRRNGETWVSPTPGVPWTSGSSCLGVEGVSPFPPKVTVCRRSPRAAQDGGDPALWGGAPATGGRGSCPAAQPWGHRGGHRGRGRAALVAGGDPLGTGSPWRDPNGHGRTDPKGGDRPQRWGQSPPWPTVGRDPQEGLGQPPRSVLDPRGESRASCVHCGPDEIPPMSWGAVVGLDADGVGHNPPIARMAPPPQLC